MQKPTREHELRSIEWSTYVPDEFGTNMKTKSNSREAGASDERDAVLAYVRRRMKSIGNTPSIVPSGTRVPRVEELMDLESWLLGRAKRYGNRKGGLGK